MLKHPEAFRRYAEATCFEHVLMHTEDMLKQPKDMLKQPKDTLQAS
jgi:hypothetical protein